MQRFWQYLGAISLGLALVACTDWDANGGAQGPVLSSVPGNGSLQPADAGTGGIKAWETWLPPGATPYDAGSIQGEDTAVADAESPDNLPVSNDAQQIEAGDDVPLIEVSVVDAEEPDGEDGQNTGDSGVADAIAADVGLLDAQPSDTATLDGASLDGAVADGKLADGGPDVDPACAGKNRPLGCYCNASAQCGSGLCVYGPTGLVCGVSCKTLGCPGGWVCTPPALVCIPVPPPDVAPDVAVQSDLGSTDGGGSDLVQDDSGGIDGAAIDGIVSDITVMDVPVADAPVGDAPVGEVDQGDGGGFDQAVGDGGLADVVDGATGVDAPKFDWQGYPDANFPADADIYGGPINSCLSLFLFQQETCGKHNPSAVCIDQIAKKGSLYANYIFEPLRACETAICTDLCALAVDETCMNQCMGKYCTGPFLGCVSNNSSDSADCAATWTCAQQYPGKLLTIGAICYANASKDAQLQLDGLISCSTKPQTESCFKQIGKCFQSASPSASCNETLQCSQACGGDQVCTWKCLGNATPQGIQFADGLFNCINSNCTPFCNGDKTCQDKCTATQCSGQLADCLTK